MWDSILDWQISCIIHFLHILTHSLSPLCTIWCLRQGQEISSRLCLLLSCGPFRGSIPFLNNPSPGRFWSPAVPTIMFLHTVVVKFIALQSLSIKQTKIPCDVKSYQIVTAWLKAGTSQFGPDLFLKQLNKLLLHEMISQNAVY